MSQLSKISDCQFLRNSRSTDQFILIVFVGRLQFDLRLQFLLMHSIVYFVIVEKSVNCYQLAVMLLLERGQIIIRVLRGLVVVEDS